MQLPYSVAPASTTDPTTRTEPTSTYAAAGGVPVPAGGGGVLSTRIRLMSRFDADASGTLVRRLLVVGPPGSSVAVYIGEAPTSTNGGGAIAPAYQVDLTRRGDGDVATYDPPLYVPPAKSLIVVWTFTAQWSGTSFARLERA